MPHDPNSPMDHSPAAPPAAPPTRGGELSMPVRKRVWPTVLGVIAIVLGSCGFLQGGSMLLMPLWQDWMGAAMPAQGTAEAFSIYANLSLLLAIVISGIAGLLLAGGIGLVRRRRWAVTIIVLWAVLKMTMTIFSAALNYMAQSAQFEAMTSQANSPVLGTFADIIVIFSLIFLILWGWSLPVFMLVWLRLKSVRAEVSSWTPPRAADRTPPTAP